MFMKCLKSVCTLGVDTIRIVTGNERSLILVTSRNLCSPTKESGFDPGDTFGTLAPHRKSYHEPEGNDEAEIEYFGKKYTLKKMKTCLDAHEYEPALKLLRDMQKKEKAPGFAYNLLISYNAKLGNAHEAFKLFNDYKKRGYQIKEPIFTSLFVACGNCQRSDIALPIAENILKQVLKTERAPNLFIYHAMLKAFGRHGEISVAFQLMDRLKAKKGKINNETYSRLLESCLSDKASGLRFALLIWHYMLKENLKPNLYMFKTIAKCIQVCSLGDIELVKQFLYMIVDSANKNKNQCKESHMLEGSQGNIMKPIEIKSAETNVPQFADMLKDKTMNNSYISDEIMPNELSPVGVISDDDQTQPVNDITLHDSTIRQENIQNIGKELPNILYPIPTLGSVIDFGNMSTSVNRFMLFGGLEGFFKVMDHFKIKPDVAVFSILVFCIPATKEAEEELLKWKDKYNVKTDIRLLNALLKRRLRTGVTYQDYFDYVSNTDIRPNCETMRVLAAACKTSEEFKKWAEFARRRRIRITEQHVFALLRQATNNSDMNYVLDVLAMAKEEQVQLGPKSIGLLKSSAIQGQGEKAQDQ